VKPEALQGSLFPEPKLQEERKPTPEPRVVIDPVERPRRRSDGYSEWMRGVIEDERSGK
jgi:hypothetical protein